MAYLNSEILKKNLGHCKIENGSLYGKFFDNTGKIFTDYYVLPKNLRSQVLYRIHESKFAGQLDRTKTTNTLRLRLFPLIWWFNPTAFETALVCTKNEEISHHWSLHFCKLILTSAFLEMFQKVTVGKLNPSSGRTYTVTAFDVFLTKYPFALPLCFDSAEFVAKRFFMWRADIPSAVLSDLKALHWRLNSRICNWRISAILTKHVLKDLFDNAFEAKIFSKTPKAPTLLFGTAIKNFHKNSQILFADVFYARMQAENWGITVLPFGILNNILNFGWVVFHTSIFTLRCTIFMIFQKPLAWTGHTNKFLIIINFICGGEVFFSKYRKIQYYAVPNFSVIPRCIYRKVFQAKLMPNFLSKK